MTKEKQAAIAAVDEKAAVIADVADSVWSYAELSLQEEKSALASTYSMAICLVWLITAPWTGSPADGGSGDG